MTTRKMAYYSQVIDFSDASGVMWEASNGASGEEYKEQENANGILKFSEKELSKMPKDFKKDFKAGRFVAHVRKKANGVFEIRCQVEKKRIAVSSKLLDTAKEKFIKAINELYIVAPTINKRVKLCDYLQEWAETVKKPAVKPITYKDYLLQLNTYIRPAFEGRELASVKGFELQTFINGFTDAGKHRTARKLYQLLAAVFDYAVMDEIITKSPMQRITLPKYEQEHGVPLTRAEEKELINQLSNSSPMYLKALVFVLYTGLRRSELASAELSEGWVKIITSKQRKGLKEKSRSLPVSPMLARVLPLLDFNELKAVPPAMLTKHIKDYFPNHHSHDLRHTFVTRCQECGIQRELVSLWVGHAADSSTTSLVYTHLEQNKEHQIDEMRKFDYRL